MGAERRGCHGAVSVEAHPPGITLLYGFPEECCIYALEGERAVAVIDTGMGKADLPGTLEALAPGRPRGRGDPLASGEMPLTPRSAAGA